MAQGRRRGRGGAVAQAGKSDSYDDELSRIDASIAELKIRDMAAAKERTNIAAKIQAAQFQRDILSHANQQSKAKKAAKPRRVRRKPGEEFPPPPPPSGHQGDAPPPPPGPAPTGAPPPPGSVPMTETPPPPPGARPAGPPPRSSRAATSAPGGRPRGSATGPRPEWSPPGSAHTGPPGVATDGVTTLVDDPPPTEQVGPTRKRPGPPPRRVGLTGGEQHPPEASTQSVQNILLAIGALLIGVAAVVFSGVAVSNPLARALILAIFTAIALVAAPGIAQRGLSSTA